VLIIFVVRTEPAAPEVPPAAGLSPPAAIAPVASSPANGSAKHGRVAEATLVASGIPAWILLPALQNCQWRLVFANN